MPRAALRARTAAIKSAAPAYAKRRQRNVRPTQWEHGEFVAVDGEGFSDGKAFEYIVGANSTRYTGREHFYAYLAASDGSSLYNPRGRIGMFDCLDFLCRIVADNPKAIVCAFGGSYDVCHMVCYDLDRDEIAKLIGQGDAKGGGKKSKLLVDDGEWAYLLEYRPRKCFTIQRWQSGARRWTEDKNGKRISTPHLTVRLWDVWGFFQDSFVGVMSKWLPEDPDYNFIKRMKGERNIFERSEIEDIKVYNQAELRCLVKIMQRVRDAINDLGLKITRWDGAGAIAAAMMTKHKVKEHKSDLPDDVFEAVRRAYSGGHIESCKIGFHQGEVHHYDVNSAYPNEFYNLPSLKSGQWISGEGEPPPGYTVVQIEYAFPDGLPFYPLFYRCEDGSILYPGRGSGWYWYPEFDVARRYYAQSRQDAYDHSIQNAQLRGRKDEGNEPQKFVIRKWYHFRSDTDERPFGWVADYYLQRQNYIAAARRGGFTSGPEKIIKLGLNSLYGKTAQQVGARQTSEGELRLPPFFQLDWAGYVTSGCRAKLMDAAIQSPQSIIAFATDGLFSTTALDLDCPEEKILGAWEYQQHAGMTVVMPGVYWLHDVEEIHHYSRGFNKKEMKEPDFIHEAWAMAHAGRKYDEIHDLNLTGMPITLERLIGLGSATMSKDYWKMRGCFAKTTRKLALNGDNSKRYPINLRRCKPHKGFIDTHPRDHDLTNILGWEIAESAPFPIAWLDGEMSRDLLEGEMADELEAMDAALA